ncbi:MAG: DNA recombination/repair protein RecA, partial [Parcubacteria group bacterium]|nr:DNA recombination/repair protein RecA [Parcubacteria group bacterium]
MEDKNISNEIKEVEEKVVSSEAKIKPVTKATADKKAAVGEKEEKLKAAGLAMDQIKERFGEGAIMKFGEAKRMVVETVPTGCVSLDIALGGGVPRGRIIEIFGPEASGKTTLSQHIVAEVQKIGGIAAFVDAEHALDPEYAKKIGVRVDDMLISQPDTGEQALE